MDDVLDVDVLLEVDELDGQAAVVDVGVDVDEPVPAVVEVDELVGLVVVEDVDEDEDVSRGMADAFPPVVGVTDDDGATAVPRRGAAPDGLATVTARPPPAAMAARPDMQSRHPLRLATFPLPCPFPQEQYGEPH